MTTNTVPAAGRIHVLEVIGNAIVGGMEQWVERLLARLPREQFRFTALCPFDGPFAERLRALEVEVFIVPMPDDPPWSSIQMALALAQSRGVDLLHAHLPKAHLLAGLVGRLAERPVLTTIHGRQVSLLDLEVHRAVGSHLSVVCQQSYFHALGLGVEPAKLSCESNGVDCEQFQPRGPETGGLREALALDGDTPLIGFVGRLSPEKGPELFVRAMRLLLDRCPDARAVFIGEGPMEGALREQARGLELGGRLHFAGLQERMPAVYAELDVLVSSSHSEAMPLALMEAMASGLPVIATRVGGVPDLIEQGRSGFLVAPGDVHEIAACCASLLQDAAQRQGLGEAARRRMVERFDLRSSVERVGELLTRLARARAEAGSRRVAALASIPTEGGRRSAR